MNELPLTGRVQLGVPDNGVDGWVGVQGGQVVLRHRGVEVVLDMVVDVVREEQPAQPGGRDVGARRGQGRGEVGRRTVLGDGAQPQDRLHDGDERQHPEDEVLDQISADGKPGQ